MSNSLRTRSRATPSLVVGLTLLVLSFVDAPAHAAAPTVQTIQLPNVPFGVTVGLGSAWYGTADNTVVRIDTATNTITATIPVGGFPARAAVGAGGVWVSNCDSNNVSRIDPATNKVTATIPVGTCPFGIDTLNGSVWVVNADNRIMRINPKTNTVSATIHARLEACTTPSCYTLRGLTVGNGYVWVSTVRSSVLRIDPSTNTVDKAINLFPCCVEVGELTLGFGSLWATIPGGGLSNMVYRVNPNSGRVTHRIIANMSDPFGIAILDHRVWVAFGNNGGSIVAAINPDNNRIVTKVDIGGFTAALATGAGSVWTANLDAVTAVRITP